jgi:hypothetical protein
MRPARRPPRVKACRRASDRRVTPAGQHAAGIAGSGEGGSGEEGSESGRKVSDGMRQKRLRARHRSVRPDNPCGAHAPLVALLRGECRWNARWFVRRNHLHLSIEKLGVLGSLAAEGLAPQGGGVRVIVRRTTELRMRRRSGLLDHRVERRAAVRARSRVAGRRRTTGPVSFSVRFADAPGRVKRSDHFARRP